MSQYRNLISVLAGIAFGLVALSGLLMEFVFKARWLMQSHIWIGVFMAVITTLHLVVNWRFFASYFRNRWMYLSALPFLAFVLLMAGQGAESAAGGGMGAAIQKMMRARSCDLAPVFGKTPEEALRQMRAAGLKVDGPEETVLAIGRANQRPPQAILSLLSQ